MNAWAVAVALTPEADRDSFADTCATMVPALNDWEGLVFAERDRLKALPNSVLTDANWPVLPAGAPQFIEWFAENMKDGDIPQWWIVEQDLADGATKVEIPLEAPTA